MIKIGKLVGIVSLVLASLSLSLGQKKQTIVREAWQDPSRNALPADSVFYATAIGPLGTIWSTYTTKRGGGEGKILSYTKCLFEHYPNGRVSKATYKYDKDGNKKFDSIEVVHFKWTSNGRGRLAEILWEIDENADGIVDARKRQINKPNETILERTRIERKKY